MSVAERRSRERARRERRITEAARTIAEAEGWGAVTIRRLADTIEYSQPVLYSHFASKDAIVAAVALDGFVDLTSALRQAAQGTRDDRQVRRKVAETYLGFAREHPALYEAMFTLPSALPFVQNDTPPELRDAFAALAAGVASSSCDVEIGTETLWATLHGLAELERAGRIRRSARDGRVALVVDAFAKP